MGRTTLLNIRVLGSSVAIYVAVYFVS